MPKSLEVSQVVIELTWWHFLPFLSFWNWTKRRYKETLKKKKEDQLYMYKINKKTFVVISILVSLQSWRLSLLKVDTDQGERHRFFLSYSICLIFCWNYDKLIETWNDMVIYTLIYTKHHDSHWCKIYKFKQQMSDSGS